MRRVARLVAPENATIEKIERRGGRDNSAITR
jgi:hypothetical protein